jgi:hypothetical protein
MAWCLKDGTFGRSGYIRLLGVQNGYTSHGAGAALLRETEQHIREMHPDVFLWFPILTRALSGFTGGGGISRWALSLVMSYPMSRNFFSGNHCHNTERRIIASSNLCLLRLFWSQERGKER